MAETIIAISVCFSDSIISINQIRSLENVAIASQPDMICKYFMNDRKIGMQKRRLD